MYIGYSEMKRDLCSEMERGPHMCTLGIVKWKGTSHVYMGYSEMKRDLIFV